jgi:S1-C subfamily serine protease
VTRLEVGLSREQIAEGQKLARNFKPREVPASGSDSSAIGILQTRPESSGTGFFITEDGYLITNEHVAGNGAQVRLVTEGGLLSARVVKVDSANDLALLKAEGEFAPLPVVSSRAVKMGGTVATVGFPNIGLQGFAPKLAKGEIAALSGAQDDPKYFQISVPVQPGNSGSALVDERGNVVGVVAAKLNVAAALATSGALPENVNYAVKSSLLLSFLESVPEVAAKLKEPNTRDRAFEDVVKSAEKAAVLVLVY